MHEISVRDLAELLRRGIDLILLDVREPQEYAIARLEGILIPLRELPQRLAELPQGREIVVYCHHGVRSRAATRFLLESGFERVRNLTGGIDAWAAEIEPRMPRY